MSREVRIPMTPESERRLERLSKRTEATKTQVVREAMRVYEHWLDTHQPILRQDDGVSTA